MDSISNSLLSDHIGNLILQELYSLRNDVKQEIRDLGVKLACLIDLKNEENLSKDVLDTSTNSGISSYLTTPQYFCDKTTDDAAIGSYHSLDYHDSNDSTPVDKSLSSHSFVEEYASVPLLECDGLTETNLMCPPSGLITSSSEKELPACSVQVTDTFSICSVPENCQTNKELPENFDDIDVICIDDDSSNKLPSSSKNNSSLLVLATALPVPSVSVLKYEDFDDITISNVHNFNVENGDAVSTDEEGSLKMIPNCKSPKLKAFESNMTETIKANLRKRKKRGRPSKSSHEENQEKIRLCNQKTNNHKASTVLSKKNGQIRKRLLCNICGKKFLHSKILALHIKKSHGERKVLCSVCKKPFANEESLKVHMQAHSLNINDESGNSSDELLECSICNKVLFTNNMFNLHMKAHFKQTSFNCKYCSKMFFGLKKLHKHMNEHRQKTTLVCKKCGKGFQNQKTYELHMNRHVRAPYSCAVCSKAFVRESTLRMHMRSFHGFTALECSYCAATFPDQKRLQAHLKCHSKEVISEDISHSPYCLRKRSTN